MAIETKPPLGLVSEKIRIENRIVEIHSAIDRYNAANYEVPAIWWDELLHLTKRLIHLS